MSLKGKLASQSTVIFASRLFGAGLIFLAQAAIARFWGADILGEYLLIFAAVNLIAVVMPLGFETIGTYFAAEYRAKGEGQNLQGFLVRAYAHTVIAGLLLYNFGPYLAGLFGEPGRILLAYWTPACLLAFATALVFVSGPLLVGLKRPFAGFFGDTIFRPLLIAGSLAVAMASGSPPESFVLMLWLVSIGFLIVALGYVVFVVMVVRRIPAEAPARRDEGKRWWRFALPWVLIALATDFFFDIDLLMLSGHLSREELAIFGVCTKVFSLVSFGVSAVYAVTMPDMFESEAMSDRDGFHRKVGDANLVATALSVLLFLLMAIIGPFALMLFGPAFQAGAAPLAVLCLALVVRSAFGPATLVLSIHDRPYASLPAIALGMATLAAGNALLVPPFGLMGAAVAAIIAITLWSGGLWWIALRTAKLDVSIMQKFRAPKPVVAPAE